MSQIFKASSGNGSNTVPVTNPISYPYEVLPTDYFIPVDTTAPRVIDLMDNPPVGFRVIVKDAVGLSNANPITIEGNGITIDGTADYVIADTWGSVVLIFNGVEWNIIN